MRSLSIDVWTQQHLIVSIVYQMGMKSLVIIICSSASLALSQGEIPQPLDTQEQYCHIVTRESISNGIFIKLKIIFQTNDLAIYNHLLGTIRR